jgi:hypothetical protein
LTPELCESGGENIVPNDMERVGDKSHSQSVFLISSECDDSEMLCGYPSYIILEACCFKQFTHSIFQAGWATDLQKKSYVAVATFPIQEFILSENKKGGWEKIE